MFRLRSRLQRRDRESGLVFSWRVPVSSLMSLVVAFLLVGGVSLALATLVRVRIGPADPLEQRTGSLVVVPAEAGGSALERFAREAGPFPNRWNPAADPEYAALRRRALREAGDPTLRYHARLMEIELPDELLPGEPGAGILPPLPEVELPPPATVPREVELGLMVLRSGEGPAVQLPGLELDPKAASASTGLRFLLRHDASGRVIEVSPLGGDPASAELAAWLGAARVTGHGGAAGGIVVETQVRP